MFLVKLIFKKPLDVVNEYLKSHRDFLEEGYQKDFFVVSGPINPRVGGVIVSQLKDKKTLQDFLQNDPFWLNEIADYEYTEFEPVKFHKHFRTFVD